MKRLFLVLAAATAVAGTHSASALQWQAELRERILSQETHLFGGDSALRVRRDLQDEGFTGFTLVMRLQMTGPNASAVFMPAYRSRRTSLETMIAAILHAKGEVIFKPLISTNGELGVADRLTNIRPTDTRLWFDTYARALGFYASLAKHHEIGEIVVATGMHNLWAPAYATNWTQMLMDLRRQAGADVRFSIELSSEADFQALQSWRAADPNSFAAFASRLNLIRFSTHVASDSEEWSASSTARRIETDYARVKGLFPSQMVSLAHVSVPACRELSWNEDEASCPSDAMFSKAYQSEGLKAFFASIDALNASTRAGLYGVELMQATTDREPDQWDFDPRFPFYNDQTPSILRQQIMQKPAPAAGSAASSAVPAASRRPASLTGLPTPTKLSCVYFDQMDVKDSLGAIHARLMENLMGAFPTWNTSRRSVMSYRAGDLSGCDVAFYLSSNFNLEAPVQFFDDLASFSQKKSVVWFNYKIPAFGEAYDRWAHERGMPGLAFNVPVIDQPMETPSADNQDPGFYRYFDYKGETFEKLAKWDMLSHRFMSSPELNMIQITDDSRVDVLAKARHSKKSSVVPYVVRQNQAQGGSLWYFADSPFTYGHYEDRFLILCDLMWDILHEEAPSGPLGAMVRIEDVNPSQNSRSLRWAIDYLSSEKVPYALAVIPYYADLFGSRFTSSKSSVLPVTEYREFTGTLRYAKAQGADFVWHGVYHQAGDLVSGYDGSSAPDYEFWLYPEDRPLPQDSTDYVLTELEKGEKVWAKLGIRPLAWEVPHYAMSALDSVMFGKVFEWNYHRGLYFYGDVAHDAPLGPQHRMLECLTDACRAERRQISHQLQVKTYSNEFAGQVIPFRVYKDTYGQALIPETLGMVDYVDFGDNSWRPYSTPEDILRRAKKLRVIRGSIASFFWHPDVADPDLPYYKRHPGHYETVGGKHTLVNIVEGLRNMGYNFLSISDCSVFPRSACQR